MTTALTHHGKPMCGAETRTCGCGHHLSRHARKEGGGRRGACAGLDGEPCACTMFRGKPHTQTRGLMPNGRCRKHGGMSPPGGPGHHRWRNGSRSTWVPKHLREHYEAALADPQLLSMREELAATRAVLRDTLSRVDGEWASPAVVRAVRRAFAQWKSWQDAEALALASDAPWSADAAVRAKQKLGRALEAAEAAVGGADASRQVRAEFRETAALYERLERSENMRVVELYNMISAERAMALRVAEHTAFEEALIEHVTDKELVRAIRRRVASRFAELAGGRDHPALDAGGRGPGDGPAGAGGPAAPD